MRRRRGRRGEEGECPGFKSSRSWLGFRKEKLLKKIHRFCTAFVNWKCKVSLNMSCLLFNFIGARKKHDREDKKL